MIDFKNTFKNKINVLNPKLLNCGYELVHEINQTFKEDDKIENYKFIYSNKIKFIDLFISISLYNNQNYIISFSMFNKNKTDTKFTWDSFFLSDYIKDNNLQDTFKYKVQGDENVEDFINQYFKNLEFALNDYLKPYVTGEKYIDHYIRMMDDYYAQTSALNMQNEIIKEHLAKQGKMAVFRQKVIGLKQDVRNYMDKVKNFFLPPNLK